MENKLYQGVVHQRYPYGDGDGESCSEVVFRSEASARQWGEALVLAERERMVEAGSNPDRCEFLISVREIEIQE